MVTLGNADSYEAFAEAAMSLLRTQESDTSIHLLCDNFVESLSSASNNCTDKDVKLRQKEFLQTINAHAVAVLCNIFFAFVKLQVTASSSNNDMQLYSTIFR